MTSRSTTINRDILESVKEIHREVDELVAKIVDQLGGVLRCREGCFDCCVDLLTVFEIEAALIRGHVASRNHQPPSPKGHCAFLTDIGTCWIYPWRPYVCRTQGLPLRWLEELESGEHVERRDICPINDDHVALLELSDELCWTLGPFEGRLAQLQAGVDGGELRRVSLFDLALRR